MRLPTLFFSHEVHTPRLQQELMSLGLAGLKPWLSLLLAVLLALVSVDHVPSAHRHAWLAAAGVATLFGYQFRHRQRHLKDQALTVHAIRRIEWNGVVYGAITGTVWGCSSWLLTPDGGLEHNVIVMTVYLGVCAGAGSISIFGLGHLLLSSVLAWALFVARFPLMFPQHWPELTVMFALFHMTIVRMAWERNRILVSNLLLRDDKQALLAQAELDAARAHRANEDKSAFLAAASHDLRQPVHALMLTSHTLRLRLPDGEHRMLVDRLVEAGHALSDQFNHLMDLSRLEGGHYRLHMSDVALAPMLMRICASHRQVAEGRHMSVKLLIARGLRGQALRTDPGLLGRCIDNMLDNAIKFSPRGRRVLLTARLQAGRLHIGVHDRGPGIPTGSIEQVFKPYVQLDNPTRERARGIGLGLSIVRQAAHLLEGVVTVRSEPGIGSCFTLDLPADLAAAPMHESTPAGEGAPPASGTLKRAKRLRGRRLLLVEDDPMAAQALITWASDWGLAVAHHADPARVDKTWRPDLILCDIRLPGARDGIDWLTQWLAQWPDARGLLISGELQSLTHQRAEQEGLLLLLKPVNPDALLQTLAGLVREPSTAQPS
jgi:two-component system, sensor histidine kinase